VRAEVIAPLGSSRGEIVVGRFREPSLRWNPGVIHGESRNPAKAPMTFPGLSRDMAFEVKALISITSTIDTLLDAETVTAEPTPNWRR